METAEQVIEEMTQGGYLIYKVLVFHPHMCMGGGWKPLEETDPLPDSANVWILGRRADDDTKGQIVECDNMRWLADWWKGGWQANI